MRRRIIIWEKISSKAKPWSQKQTRESNQPCLAPDYDDIFGKPTTEETASYQQDTRFLLGHANARKARDNFFWHVDARFFSSCYDYFIISPFLITPGNNTIDFGVAVASKARNLRSDGPREKL